MAATLARRCDRDGRGYDSPMPAPRSLLVERFRRLPRRSSETWQGGVVRARTWIEQPDGRVQRPWAAVWVSLGTGMMNVQLSDEAADAGLALGTLVDLGLKFVRARPAAIEVADATLGTQLREALGDPELSVSVRADLPAVAEALRAMEEGTSDRPPLPEALDAPGVTVERMRAFAEAARAFYEAAPWQYLSDEDLVHVKAPPVASGLRHFTVLGAGATTFGLGFFTRRRDFQAVQLSADRQALLARDGRWTVLFGALDEMPFGDADLWEDERLGVAGPSAYPVAMWFGPDDTLRRPRAHELADITTILGALGRTTEAQIDSGRWSHEVPGHDGPVRVTLAIPSLLAAIDAPPPGRPGAMGRRAMERLSAEVQRIAQQEMFESLEELNSALRERFTGPIDALPSTARTSLERAQDLMYSAFDAHGRRRIQLARRALELSADCADAYVLLAEESRTPDAALPLWEKAVAAGERALGLAAFTEQAGHFWCLVHTRPYMRARFGLAQSLEDFDRRDEAIAHYQELLRLNPDDNQGVRYALLAALMLTGRDDETPALLARFQDDPTARWLYGRALAIFRREGDSRAARDALRAALRSNRHVPQYLTADDDVPIPPPAMSVTLGSREEAVVYDLEQGEAWEATPEAIRWLRAQAPARRSGKRRKR